MIPRDCHIPGSPSSFRSTWCDPSFDIGNTIKFQEFLSCSHTLVWCLYHWKSRQPLRIMFWIIKKLLPSPSQNRILRPSLLTFVGWEYNRCIWYLFNGNNNALRVICKDVNFPRVLIENSLDIIGLCVFTASNICKGNVCIGKLLWHDNVDEVSP